MENGRCLSGMPCLVSIPRNCVGMIEILPRPALLEDFEEDGGFRP
jgi:hypothetical protein